MTSSTISVGKFEHYVFIISKLMLEVSMFMISSSQGNATTLLSLMIFIMILLTSIDLIVSIINNSYNDEGLNVIIKSLKFMFQYSLFNCI